LHPTNGGQSDNTKNKCEVAPPAVGEVNARAKRPPSQRLLIPSDSDPPRCGRSGTLTRQACPTSRNQNKATATSFAISPHRAKTWSLLVSNQQLLFVRVEQKWTCPLFWT